MITPASAAPTPRPPAVTPERPDSAARVPSPRSSPAPVDRATKLLLDGLAGLSRPVPAVRPPRRRTTRPAGVGWAPASTRSTTTKSTTNSSLSFLKDPKLSIEEKLMRLLGYLNQKWEREMQAKLDQIAAGEKGGTSKSSSTKSKKSGGILGNIVSAASGLLGAVGVDARTLGSSTVQGLLGKLGGPVLAAAASALGFPALAPTLLKIGPSVLGAVAGVASSAAAGPSGAEASATSGGGMKDSERQQIVLDIQRITNQQKEMFGLVSNILKANHDMRSSIIGNIR